MQDSEFDEEINRAKDKFWKELNTFQFNNRNKKTVKKVKRRKQWRTKNNQHQ